MATRSSRSHTCTAAPETIARWNLAQKVVSRYQQCVRDRRSCARLMPTPPTINLPAVVLGEVSMSLRDTMAAAAASPSVRCPRKSSTPTITSAHEVTDRKLGVPRPRHSSVASWNEMSRWLEPQTSSAAPIAARSAWQSTNEIEPNRNCSARNWERICSQKVASSDHVMLPPRPWRPWMFVGSDHRIAIWSIPPGPSTP